ncbi:hypothetical protein ACFRJ1_35060 [Streptomyces sp. NPDC056773]|uniref:hypothetical protein n=1 Tax=unclassified Streptomyces TaxID=2593676 RepID=UPI0036800CDA
MRFTSAVIASALAVGALLGGLTVSAGTDASQTVQYQAAAPGLPTDPVVSKAEDDHGNG